MRLTAHHLSHAIALVVTLVPAICHAEIYMRAQGQDERSSIHLTNIPGQPNFEVLIYADPAKPDATTLSIPTNRAGPARPYPYANAVAIAANETGLQPSLLHAVITAESGGNPKAISPKGARGLMQLMPSTGSEMGLSDHFDPVGNVLAGARYLKQLQQKFGSVELALAAYNAGPAAVMRYGNRIPPYAETINYVNKVMQLTKAGQN